MFEPISHSKARAVFFLTGLTLTTLTGSFVSQSAAAQQQPKQADNLRQMFTQGSVDGYFRLLNYNNHNAFFDNDDREAATIGGKIGYTTASLHGFSLRLSAYAQRNFTSTNPANRDLQDDISTLGEAYIQWQGDDLRIRAGNQALKNAPFTSTYDFRIIPQLYQGVKLRYGDAERYLTVMRMFRYKSRINDEFARKTNYNQSFKPFPANTSHHTDGFWAIGAGNKGELGPTTLEGRAWFFNYMDYANMYYGDATITQSTGSIKPFASIQAMRETDTGDAYLGEIDNQTYGARVGLKHNSLTASLSYDYMPHETGAFLNGAPVTPYATQEASGPLFAQPYLTSTQDLGAGNAYAVNVKGAPTANTFVGARYSYMDLKPAAGADSIGQSEYLVFGFYHFQGALEGFSVGNFFAYQTQKHEGRDYWENRFSLQYEF
ncbi:outer membrane porin, OprD family [Salinisphaera sp. USBA-960]|nr:outer membrane porin, OprD family [Salifodinibacter halophilus]NNC26517.1 outer membrane porin, OprD family [Salifodinibacter halophilus]